MGGWGFEDMRAHLVGMLMSPSRLITNLNKTVKNSTNLCGCVDPKSRIKQNVIDKMAEKLNTAGQVVEVFGKIQERLKRILCDVVLIRL